MAAADYRLCDVCGGKAFYDADLGYEMSYRDGDPPDEELALVAGKSNKPFAYKLHYLGDWAVICRACAKTHRTQIVPIEKQEQSA